MGSSKPGDAVFAFFPGCGNFAENALKGEESKFKMCSDDDCYFENARRADDERDAAGRSTGFETIMLLS